MKAADLSQPVARKREGKVRWCKSAAMDGRTARCLVDWPRHKLFKLQLAALS